MSEKKRFYMKKGNYSSSFITGINGDIIKYLSNNNSEEIINVNKLQLIFNNPLNSKKYLSFISKLDDSYIKIIRLSDNNSTNNYFFLCGKKYQDYYFIVTSSNKKNIISFFFKEYEKYKNNFLIEHKERISISSKNSTQNNDSHTMDNEKLRITNDVLQSNTELPFKEKGQLTQLLIEKDEIEQKLKQKNEIIESLINSIDDGFLIVNKDGDIIHFNNEYLRVFESCEEDIISKKIWEINTLFFTNSHTGKVDIERVKKSYQSYYNSPIDIFKNTTREVVINSKEGKTKHILESIFKFEGCDEKFVCFRFKDITSRKYFDFNKEVNVQYEATRIMLKGLAHNFNTRFQAIIGNISLAMSYVNKEDKIYNFLQNAIDCFPKINDLMKQFQLLTDEHEYEFSYQRIDPIFNNLLNESDLHKYQLIIDDFESPIIYCNLYLLKDALMNIIQNSKEAMEKGGVIKITFDNVNCINENFVNKVYNDYFCINISDEGIGIPEEYLDKIFDPFFTTNISQKKGLGLTNAYSIIKKHNGMVKVDSIVGKGTTVKIMLPIAKLN